MSSKTVILVTGATGMTGREVCRQLVEAPGLEIRAALHSPDKRTLLPEGVTAVSFDTEAPETVRTALEGVDVIYLATPGGPAGPPLTRVIMDAAKASSVERVVKLSSLDPEKEPQVPTDHWALEAEGIVRDSRIPYTFLGPPWFFQNFSHGYFVPMIMQRTIPLPFGDGRAAWVDVRDVAAAAVSAMLEDGHEGKTYTPTGPALISLAEIAHILSRVIGTEIIFHPLSDEEWHQFAETQGTPRELAAAQLALITKTRDGHTTQITNDVEILTGQSPYDFDQFARDHVDLFRSLASTAEG